MSQPMPPTAMEWTNFFNVVGYIAVAAVTVTMVFMVYFTARYHHRGGKPTFSIEKGMHKSRARDAAIFAAISITILTILSILQFTMTPNARFSPPSDAMVVRVTAFQWNFEFQYPNGVTTMGEVNLPSDTIVIFNVTSPDVYHNFFLLEYKTSIDAIPGRYNVIWIRTPSMTGDTQYNYHILCKELCGVGHTYMASHMTVMSQSAFNQWLSNQTTIRTGTGV